MNRRSLLGSVLLAVATRPLTWSPWISAARASDRNWRHGVSSFGDLKYSAGFRHFEYVNADAPKGGTARLIAFGTFDNFNAVVAGVKGSLAAGIDLVYETPLAASCPNSRTASGQWCGRATRRIPAGRPLPPPPVQLTGLVGNAVCIVAAAGAVAWGAVPEWSRIAVRRAAMAKRS